MPTTTQLRRTVALSRAGLLVAIVCWLAGALPAVAQVGRAAGSEPAAPSRAALRFLTDNDFPPFHFLDEEGVLTGFNVDIAQAICLELGAACEVQAKAWDQLLPALAHREADAVIASHAVTPRLLADYGVSERYFHNVGRFAAQRSQSIQTVTPEALDGRRIAVARGTPHEGYLRAFFRDSQVQTFETVELARDALVAGKADFLFDDGASLVFWLAGTLSKACCHVVGGPFFEPRFFGDGVGIVVRKNDLELRAQINQALDRVRASGRYDELVLKYFPIRAF